MRDEKVEMTITEDEYLQMKARVNKTLGRELPETSNDGESDTELESRLQGKIMKYCKENGFPCQCFRKSRKAIGFLVPGWPD